MYVAQSTFQGIPSMQQAELVFACSVVLCALVYTGNRTQYVLVY